MSNTYSIFRDIQTEIKARLDADEYFDDITVIIDKDADILPEVQKALGTTTSKDGKMGACVIVAAPKGKNEAQGVPGGQLSFVCQLIVCVQPVINNDATSGTQKDQYSIAYRIKDVLDGYTPKEITHAFSMVDDEDAIEEIPCPIEGATSCSITFITLESGRESYAKVNTPVLSISGSTYPRTVTITCGTASAAIYYTLDGSHPWSGNTNAHLYSTSISVTEACTLRAVGYKAGSIASDAVSHTFN